MLSCNIGNYLIKRQSESYIIIQNIYWGLGLYFEDVLYFYRHGSFYIQICHRQLFIFLIQFFFFYLI